MKQATAIENLHCVVVFLILFKWLTSKYFCSMTGVDLNGYIA